MTVCENVVMKGQRRKLRVRVYGVSCFRERYIFIYKNAALQKFRQWLLDGGVCSLQLCPLVLAFERMSLPAQLDVRYNDLGADSEAAIKEAVSGKAGFKLKL